MTHFLAKEGILAYFKVIEARKGWFFLEFHAKESLNNDKSDLFTDSYLDFIPLAVL